MAKKKTKKPKPRKLTGIRINGKNEVTHYKIEGNTRVTPIQNVVNMAAKDLIKNVSTYDAEFVRSDPDNKLKNNLRNLPRV